MTDFPEPTPEQELIRRLAQWKGIATHQDAENLFTRFGHPEWIPIFDEVLAVMAPWEYARDEAPNVHHPEWDHLRTEPWDKFYKESHVAAGGKAEDWTRYEG